MDSTHPFTRESTIFFLLVATFFAGAIMLFLFFVLRIEKNITSYAECIQSRTSKILESYPEICVSAGGKRFVNPDATLPSPPLESSASPTPQPVTFSLPEGWAEVTADPRVVAEDEKIVTHEFAKRNEQRAYPVGRVTLQYTEEAGQLAIPSSVFEPEGETLSGIPYTVVIGEENGYQYRVYYGQSPGQKYFLRIFTRFTSAAEREEQRAILSTFQFTQ